MTSDSSPKRPFARSRGSPARRMIPSPGQGRTRAVLLSQLSQTAPSVLPKPASAPLARRPSFRPGARLTRQWPGPASSVRHCPMPSKFSRLKPSGSIRAWQLAHVGFFRCISSISRTDNGLFPVLLASRAGMLGGGGGTGARGYFRAATFRGSSVRCGWCTTSRTERQLCPTAPNGFHC
jgi:hypothetical protein